MPDIISSFKDLISIYLVKVLSLIIIFLIRYNNRALLILLVVTMRMRVLKYLHIGK